MRIGACVYLYDTEYKRGKRHAMFICPICERAFEATIDNVKRGNTFACGCLKYKHGLYGSILYIKWNSIKNRCYNPNTPNYNRYGGRGIRICDQWIDDPESFIRYIKELPNCGKPGYSLDRINNNGNYEPDNLRWATATQQQLNRGIPKDNTSGYKGVGKENKGYYSRITHGGISVRLGHFKTKEQAYYARQKYKIEHEI